MTPLLDKLRALEMRYNATVDDYDGNQSAVNYAHDCAAHDLADLLPQIIAQIESDAKALIAADELRTTAQRYSDGDKAVPWVVVRDALHEWASAHDATITAAIDAAKERT